jgi:hypothetical protein
MQFFVLVLITLSCLKRVIATHQFLHKATKRVHRTDRKGKCMHRAVRRVHRSNQPKYKAYTGWRRICKLKNPHCPVESLCCRKFCHFDLLLPDARILTNRLLSRCHACCSALVAEIRGLPQISSSLSSLVGTVFVELLLLLLLLSVLLLSRTSQ